MAAKTMEKQSAVMIVEALREMASSLTRKANRTDLPAAAEVYRKRGFEYQELANALTGRNIIVE